MWTLRIVTHIPPHKRQEFAQSVQELLGPERSRGCRPRVLQDLDDRSLFCCMADWDDPEALRTFLESSAFGALKGAAQVLGGIEEIVVLEDEKPGHGDRTWPHLT